MKELPVLLIAGMNKLGCIGNDEGGLIVDCPRDLQRFKELSKNGVLIVGRKTYESLPKALPERSYVVVSEETPVEKMKHPKGVCAEDFSRVADIRNAINAAFTLAEAQGRDKIVIAGGAAIYEYFLLEAERLYITRFDSDELTLAKRFPISDLSHMIASGRLVKADSYEFYDGELKVTFEEYNQAMCIESVVGDFVKLRNGARFRKSAVNTYMLTDEYVMIAQVGFGFKVYPEEMNLNQLAKELDQLMAKPDEISYQSGVALNVEQFEDALHLKGVNQ